MSFPRRDFLSRAALLGAAFGLSPCAATELGKVLESAGAQASSAGGAISFASFMDQEGVPYPVRSSASGAGLVRGGDVDPQNVCFFCHDETHGFFDPTDLNNTAGLIPKGDVTASVSSQVVRWGQSDFKKYHNLGNAQVRVDVAQRLSILPELEPLVYTFAAAMHSMQSAIKSKSGAKSGAKHAPDAGKGAASHAGDGGGSGGGGAIQPINFSNAAWQKMQTIPLPGGMGRWSLVFEGQRGESGLGKILKSIITETNRFAPFLSFPGIALSALNSFGTLYDALRSNPVTIMGNPPVPVIATQDALQKLGDASGSSGIALCSASYVLFRGEKAPTLEALNNNKLTVVNGRIVAIGAPRQPSAALDEAANDVATLSDATYVTFQVQTQAANLLAGA